MAIKGLTDNLTPGFPELGKLRKGGPKKNGQFGPDLDHFRFTSDRPDVMKAFRAVYDGKPTLINVFLPYPNAQSPDQDGEACFSAWCEKWNASNTLLHRCDGEHVVRYYDGKTGKWKDPEPGTMKCPGGCVQTGRLTVVIPELYAAGLVGYVTMETHSKNDIISILKSLLETERRRKGNPDGLMNVRFTLQRVPETVSTPSWGDEPKDKRHRQDKWLVKLVPAAEWVQMQLEAGYRATLQLQAPEEQPTETPEETLARGNMLLHCDPDEEDIDTVTGEIVDDDPQGPESPAQPVVETAQNDEVRLSPEQQAAYYFTLPSGKMLGQCGIDELLKLKDWCDEHPNQANAQATLLHVNVMLDYVAPDAEI
jgi:hypothetical protein